MLRNAVRGLCTLVLLSLILNVLVFAQENNHWAQIYEDKLNNKYEINSLLENKNLDEYISSKEFKGLIQKTIDSSFNEDLQNMNREEVTNALIKIWANKNKKDLNEIKIPKSIVFEDSISKEYSNSILIGYFNGLVKGKEEKLFYPKEKITYAEVITLIYRIDMENINKGGNKGIAIGYFETRGSYNIEKEKITFDFELFSNYERNVNVTFLTGQQFEIVITNENNNEVYRYSDNKVFTQDVITKNINPAGSLNYTDTWNMVDKKGNKISNGKFKVKIEIKAVNNHMIKENELNKELEFEIK